MKLVAESLKEESQEEEKEAAACRMPTALPQPELRNNLITPVQGGDASLS